MGKVYVFLAEGFEEIEALTPVDFLRRAEVEVCTVGLGGGVIEGSHGIRVQADVDGTDFALPEDAAMLVLPGGGRGTQNLLQSAVVQNALREAKTRDIYIAAICAAPLVLQKAGLLAGKTVTAYPEAQPLLQEATVTGRAVEEDGKLITGRAAGTALAFAHRLAAVLAGRQKADAVLADIYPGD